MNTRTLKPCIECGKDCEILPVQLGDMFTLSYLRVCSGECMFLIAYEFLREIFEHKQFLSKLYDMQNYEDNTLRDEYIDFTTKEFLKAQREHFEENPTLLSTPIPNVIFEMFGNQHSIPQSCGTTMRFTRPSKKERIKWTISYIKQLKKQLYEEENSLKKLYDENTNS